MHKLAMRKGGKGNKNIETLNRRLGRASFMVCFGIFLFYLYNFNWFGFCLADRLWSQLFCDGRTDCQADCPPGEGRHYWRFDGGELWTLVYLAKGIEVEVRERLNVD